MWYFLKSEYPIEFNFDHSLKDFFERGVEGLVRENIQNSLDAKDLDKNLPVKVEINSGKLKMSDIPGINDLIVHINSLRSKNEYAYETIENMLRVIKDHQSMKQDIPFLSFEDSNTTGLTGVPRKDKLDTDGSWFSYAYYRGSHHNTDMENMKSVSGGSHGIGKISSNAASNLHLMYFINKDKFGNENISGNISLIDHKIDDKCYTGNGIFTKFIKEDNQIPKFYPPLNNNAYPFCKESQGLKIIIPFLSSKYNNIEKIVKSVCDNFFVAILDGELEVSIDEIDINKDTIADIVKDERFYPIQDRYEMRDDHTPIYVDTYLNYKLNDKIVIDDKFDNSYSFDVYYQTDENIKSGRIAIVRKIGMTIENRKVSGFIHNGPFSGILIPSDIKTDSYLKKLENASHTKFEYESIANPLEAKTAKKFLQNLNDKIIEYIENSRKEEVGDVKDVDTSDMIYSMVNILEKNTIPISQTNNTRGNGNIDTSEKDKSDFSTSSKNPNNEQSDPNKGFIDSDKVEEESEKLKNDRKKAMKDNKEKYKKRNKSSNNPNNSDDDDVSGNLSTKSKSSILTSSIKRVQLSDKEIIKIDTSDLLDENIDKANIYFYLIDGTGKVGESSIDLAYCFDFIKDKNKDNKLKFRSNKVYGASIYDGKINLELNFNNNYNKDYKFNIDVEYERWFTPNLQIFPTQY